MTTKRPYVGKAKEMHPTDDPSILMMRFTDDISAFDGKQVDSLKGKGAINAAFNQVVFSMLENEGVKNCLIDQVSMSPTDYRVIALDMLPVECIVRNFSAGSFCKRYGVDKGMVFDTPTFELCVKSDELGDPFIAPNAAVALKMITNEQALWLEFECQKINKLLTKFLGDTGLTLVDFKLEFGTAVADGEWGNVKWKKGDLMLGDEFSPDSCRLWDETGVSLDKDRYRQSLGDVLDGYNEALELIR